MTVKLLLLEQRRSRWYHTLDHYNLFLPQAFVRKSSPRLSITIRASRHWLNRTLTIDADRVTTNHVENHFSQIAHSNFTSRGLYPGRNRETLAIFVKEARAREHIYITRGAIRTWDTSQCPPGVRVWASSSHPTPIATLPLRSHARSSGVCAWNPSRLLRVRAQDPLYQKTRSNRGLHIHLAGSTSKAANLIPWWPLVRM